jgi:hypothetical protein
MTMNMDIFETLRNVVSESPRSLRSIDRDAKISASLLSRVCDGTRGVSLERAERVFKVLGYNLTIKLIEGSGE